MIASFFLFAKVLLVNPREFPALLPKDTPGNARRAATAVSVAAAAFLLQPDASCAADADWWSLAPITRPLAPVADGDGAAHRHPIDAFVAQKHRERGLSYSSEAAGSTLVRRLYFDLVGMPPTPDEMRQWTARLDDPNTREVAYRELVDGLLNSPRYGERWARHWLDVVHYGDTHGYDKDKLRPNAWPYRDYVIRAFNEDRPYGRFILEQVAGDVLYPQEPHLICATGFLVAGPWDFIGHVEVSAEKIDGRVARYLDRDDMVANTLQTFTSLTVQCARCHDHKFDPITQEDYFSLQAVFAAIGRNDRPYDIDAATARKRFAVTSRVEKLSREKKRLEQITGERAQSEDLRRQLREVESSLAAAKERLANLPPSAKVVFAAATHFMPEGHHRPSLGKPSPIFILDRGEIDQHGKLVRPRALQLPGDLAGEFDLDEQHAEGDRRAALARWLADRNNPLTWRSIVNRIWHYHFGRGIVNSPSDFGMMGDSPTHPALLDWLAVEFRDGGEWITTPQSIKQLHKLVVTSRTYRQASTHVERHASVDSENRYYWRGNRRRLEAEAIRDAVLYVAGKLDTTMYGPGFRDFVIEQPDHSPQFIFEKHDPDDPASHRRSIYRFLPRSQPQPFMEVLDCADPSQQVARRDETVTALSALALLNNKFMLRMAEHFALRLEAEAEEVGEQIEAAFELAVCRAPLEDERTLLVQHAEQFGLPSACRVLFNLNEFVFVD